MDLSVDPEMLGRIFENLLAEINPDTGEAARKTTGSFYTPRSVVDYMVDRTICSYLERKTSILPEKLNALISYDQIDDVEFPLEGSEKKAVALALHKFKIFDPACGSGAFPIGMLQKLVWIQQQVDPNAEIWLDVQLSGLSNELQKHLKTQVNNQKFDYLRKLSVIRESLFGVDIQPIATEMSRLRCFLTLIVEEDVNDNEDNRGIQPLPNLEFKFITANSLLDLSEVNEDTSNHPSMFDDNKLLNELKDMRDKYFTSTGNSRSKIVESFFKVQKEMQSNLNTLQFGETTKAFRKLAEWDPFGVDGVDWFDPQWMFGVSEFDAVICNPPYVGEKGHKEIFREIRHSGLGKFYQGKMDLFYFFFHLALNCAKNGAIITFITTNYFPTASGARSLRSDLRGRSSIIEIINFNELRIFESALGQHNMITILSKSKEQTPVKILSVNEKGNVKSKNLEELLCNASSSTIFAFLPESKIYDGIDNYIRFPSVGFEEILEKMVPVHRHLIDICNVNTGIQTGADKFSRSLSSKYPLVKADIGEGIFQINFNESNKFKNKMRLKPFFKNSDVKRWFANEISISNLIYLRPEDSISKEEIKHLEKFKIILEDRWEPNAQGSNPWWMLWRPRKLEIFEGEKILCSQRSMNNRFAFTSKPWFASADVYFITPKSDRVNLKSILGLLNSRLYYLWLYHKGKRKGDVLELYQTPLSEIPIPVMDAVQEKEIEKLTDLAISSAREGKLEDLIKIEKMIDNYVYDLFDLELDERAAVDEFWNTKKFTSSNISIDD
jgi:adenine-specific DNA-methyltransferase